MCDQRYPTKRDMLNERYGKLYRRLQSHMSNIKLEYNNKEELDLLFNVKDFIKTALAMEELLIEDKGVE